MTPLHLFLSFTMISNMILFDFTKDSNLNDWTVVDDVVMGGRSDGFFGINQEGHGVFQGNVSLENNGGFSSVRYNCNPIEIERYSKIKIRLKGDGKSYQFRAKSSKFERHSYIYTFDTSGDWETIYIPLSEMEPRFRGRKLSMPNYPAKVLEEIAFLIGNKRAEFFTLEIDKIILE